MRSAKPDEDVIVLCRGLRDYVNPVAVSLNKKNVFESGQLFVEQISGVFGQIITQKFGHVSSLGGLFFDVEIDD